MKTTILLSIAIIAMVATAHAQSDYVKNQLKSENQDEKGIKKEVKNDRKVLRKLKGEQVSSFAKKAFYRDFGDIPGTTWKRGTTYDEASFTKDDMAMIAYYDYDAKLVGTVTEKSFVDLPEKAQDYINKKYADYTKEKVVFFADNKSNDTDMLLYGQQFDDDDNYFVELSKGTKKIIVEVNMQGAVLYFTHME